MTRMCSLTPVRCDVQRQDLAALRDLDDVFARTASIVDRGRDAFDADDAIRLACETLAARVGEIARERLTDEYRQSRSDVPWRDIIRMRHLLVHQYHRADYTIVWATVSRKMPMLRKQLAEDLATARGDPEGFSAVASDLAQKTREAAQRGRRPEPDRPGAPTWVPDTARCGSTDTRDGRPCRNPVTAPGQRCRQHR